MNPGKEEEKEREGGDVAGKVAESYRRVLSACCVGLFRWTSLGSGLSALAPISIARQLR